jgi:hypothetical protein
VQVLFQTALALGAPWGDAAWGGGYPGTLPAWFRVASGVGALAWLWVLLVVVRRSLGPTGRRRVLLVVAAYSTFGILANAASPSVLERAIWAPYCVVTAALAWWAWRAARVEREALAA